ncbi:type I restriction endonuclease [Streptomyces sp. WZ-12]|uniref:type I restriction endonuclease n=1 Tax=Streptomyces sp. WZ-12 TaxID=3030210 RepID=UPI002380E748|nr:type I restriction endonuclease [Streptomyces sp. WZ-12]
MIQWLLPMGWDFTAGRSLSRETTQTMVVGQLRDPTVRLTPGVIDGFDADAMVEEIVGTVNAVKGGLVRANAQVMNLPREHKEFRDTDGVWHALKVIDFEQPTANTLVVSVEVTITVPGKTSRRFDLVYWVNSLPLVRVEAKSLTAKSGWADAAREINGRKGLIWHHQGSGKTLLMVFAASLLLADTRPESPTIILLSDRTDLVRQTSGVSPPPWGRLLPQACPPARSCLPAGRRRARRHLHDRPQVRRCRQ